MQTDFEENNSVGFFTSVEQAARIVMSFYIGEPCRICGKTLTWDDAEEMVFAGYSKNDKDQHVALVGPPISPKNNGPIQRMLMLIRITSPYFCAGYDMTTGNIAPIIKYMKQWNLSQIREYCVKMGWEFESLNQSQ